MPEVKLPTSAELDRLMRHLEGEEPAPHEVSTRFFLDMVAGCRELLRLKEERAKLGELIRQVQHAPSWDAVNSELELLLARIAAEEAGKGE